MSLAKLTQKALAWLEAAQPNIQTAIELSGPSALMPDPRLYSDQNKFETIYCSGPLSCRVCWNAGFQAGCETVTLAPTFLRGLFHPLRADRAQGRA